MFCAFDGAPRIVRVTGTGEAVFPDDARFAELAARFPELPGVRSVIVVAVDRVADSCGYGVPRMELLGERDRLQQWSRKQGDAGLADYRRKNNA